MYFMINNRKVFDKFNEIWKVSNFIKKINSELVYNKKYIKRENKMNTKESLQCFYIPVMLIDSVYRKDENYYPKVILEKHNLIKIQKFILIIPTTQILMMKNVKIYFQEQKDKYDEFIFLRKINIKFPPEI